MKSWFMIMILGAAWGLASCRGRLDSDQSNLLTVGGACLPVGHAAVPGLAGSSINVRITVGRFTTDYRLQCMNIQGTNATIYKKFGDPESQHVWKIPHNTESARENYLSEYQLFVEFKKKAQNRSKAFASYLVPTDPATFFLPSGDSPSGGIGGFRKVFVQGQTMAQLGRLDPKNPGHQKIILKAKDLYVALRNAVLEGYNIDDINDHNVMWSPAEERLWVIDGHLEQDVAPTFNKLGAFDERCQHDWVWCREAKGAGTPAVEVY